MFSRAFLGIPDADPAPQDGYVAAWSANAGRSLWKPITGALLSGFTAGLIAFGVSGGGLTQDATLSYSGGVLSASNLKSGGLSSGRVTFSTTGGQLTDSASLTFSVGTLTVGDNTTNSGFLSMNGPASAQRAFRFRTANVTVWECGTSGTESGANAGANLSLDARSDAGAFIDSPISVTRAAGGALTFARPTRVTDTTASSSTSTGALVVGSGSNGGLGVAGDIYGGATLNIAGNGTFSSSSPFVTLTASGNAGELLRFTANSGTVRNWAIAHNFITAGNLEFIPSAANGNTTFSTVAMTLYGTSGNATVGDTGDQGCIVNIGRVRTLGASLGSVVDPLYLQPKFTAASAFSVARAGYIYLASPSAAGSASVTDACVVYFDAAAGTHKALDGSTTKTTPGAVSAWVKVDVQGTLYYIPAYTSKTT